MKKIDITGRRFGRLIVSGYHSTSPSKKRYWLCVCDCGTEKIISSSNLVCGHTTSCGCYWKEGKHKANYTHGCTSTKEFKVWAAMKSRCFNPNTRSYKAYGGRGITVDPAWVNSFEQFLSDMGLCPTGLTLERKDNNKGYSKGNCVWATKTDQANNKRNNIILTSGEITLTLQQWIKKIGCSGSGLYCWVRQGRTLDAYIAFLTTKLDAEKVMSIKSDYIPRIFGSTKLSQKYNVPVGTVKGILSGLLWKHIIPKGGEI
jgi:hypothetical protein